MDIFVTVIELIKAPFSGLPPSIVIATFWLALITCLLVHYFTIEGNSIPGPRGVPVFGYLPYFGKQPHKTFLELRNKYGDVFSLQMGSFPSIVISGSDLIKEALVTAGDDFSGRPDFYTTSLLNNGESLTFGTFSTRRQLQRQVASNVIYGFSNAREKHIQDLIHEEVDRLCCRFEEAKGVEFDPSDGIFLSVGSVLYQLCYGRIENIRNDKLFCQFVEASREFTKFTGVGNPIDVLPWLRFVMPWKLVTLLHVTSKLSGVIETKLKEQIESYSDDHGRHLMDGLLKVASEMDKTPEYDIKGDHIRHVITDITSAGFETLSTTLNWGILLMAANPEAQSKVHAEIEEFVGSRSPRLDDKVNLHFTMATINEIMRFSCILPFATPHATTRDTELKGFKIRKGTVVIPNFYSVTHDDAIWGDPRVFRPERFLDSQGKLDKNKTDQFTVFSLGRRKCMGEYLARMEVFLFFTNILQKCELKKPDGVREYSMEGSFGLTVKPKPYQISISRRNETH